MATPNYMLSGLERELELYRGEEHKLDAEKGSAAGTEYFWPFTGKAEDAKTELLKFIETTDPATRAALVAALQRKLQAWINISGPLELAKIALIKAKQFADIASLPTNSPSRVASNVGLALDAVSMLKDITIVAIGIEAALSVPAVVTSLFTLASVAAQAGQAVTRSVRILNALRTVYSTLQLAKAAASPALRISHLQKAKTEMDNIQHDAVAELNQGRELEFDGEEYEFESDELYEGAELDYEDEFEDDYELENELNTQEDEGVAESFANRLHELSGRSFESEYELEMELDNALEAMENEYMVKRLQRKKKRGKRKGLFKKILSTGAKIAGKVAGKTPIGSLIKAGTSLVRGNIKGALGNLAKAAVGTALGPVAGTVATSAIDALSGGGEEGGEEGEIRRGGRRRRAMRRVARIARDAYREGADTLPENFDHPLVANEVARNAVRKAMVKNGVRPPARSGGAPGQRRVIQLRPGEKVVIVRS